MIGHDETARLAQAILDFRRIRPDALPSGLFAETGWELLLELFIADAKGSRMTARQFVSDADAHLATTSRWLKFLTEEGLIQGDGDGDGDIDDPLMLTGKGLQQMEELLARAEQLQQRLLSAYGSTGPG